MSAPQRGEIYDVRPDPSVGKEIQKVRPCVVVSSNVLNENSDLVVVCPITGGVKLGEDVIHIAVDRGAGNLSKDSIILCEQIKAVDKARLMEKRGSLEVGTMQKIDKGLRIILNLHQRREG